MSAFVPPIASPAIVPSASPTLSASVVAPPSAPLHSRRASAPSPSPAPAPSALPSRAHAPAPAAGGRNGTVVVWFRGDLRLHDHPALVHALEEGRRVVPVYCFDPRMFGRTAFGFEKTGRYRAKFLVEAVGDMREMLRRCGGDLVVRCGKPEEVLVEVCRRVGAERVFYHREISYEEQLVEERVGEALEGMGVERQAFWANTLYHVEDLPFELRDMPDVYTEFREAVQKKGEIRAPLPAPEEMPGLPKQVDVGEIPTLKQLGLSEPDPAAHGLHTFVGGESEALRRLTEYIAETRAVPTGRSTAVHLGADFSCKISPWLALGCVSPRRIHAELEARAMKAGVTSTYFELVWRDFFRFITQKYARSRIEGADGTPTRRAGKGMTKRHGQATRLAAH